MFHVFNKSIAGYKIFNEDLDYKRFIFALKFYSFRKRYSFSMYWARDYDINEIKGEKTLDIISYVLMPTHFHLIINAESEKDISSFCAKLLDGYTRYFNLKHKRAGPLWQGRSKKIHIKNESYLLHLTRYIHLNPVTAFLASHPKDWPHSSYGEFTSQKENICSFKNHIDVLGKDYEIFCEDRISYQRELASIKDLICE